MIANQVNKMIAHEGLEESFAVVNSDPRFQLEFITKYWKKG